MKHLAHILLAIIALAVASPARAQFADQATWGATGGGSAAAQSVTIPNVSSLADLVGVPIRFLVGTTNAANATLAVSGLTPTTIKKLAASLLTNLDGGEMVAGFTATVVYDGTFFQLLPANSNGVQLVNNPQIGNYTIVASDCGKQVVTNAGSPPVYTISLPNPATVPASCVVYIKNPDTRGKLLSGFPSDFGGKHGRLWPTQSGAVNIVGGAWATLVDPGLWRGNPNIQLFMNATFGSDTNNDCLSTGSGACETIQGALNILYQEALSYGFQPIIQVESGQTFTENASAIGQVPGAGGGCVIIRGNPSSPASISWLTNGSGSSLIVNDYACVIVDGFTMTSVANNSIGFNVGKYSDLAFENIIFGPFPGASSVHMNVFWGHIVWEGGTYVVNGNVAYHALNFGGTIEISGAGPISIPSPMTFNTWFSNSNLSKTYLGTTFAGPGSGAASAGKKCDASMNSVINLSGTTATVPGATACTTSTGGQVIP